MTDEPISGAQALAARQLLGRFLAGSGLEIGPGESPFPIVFGGATVCRVDQWGSRENATLFREIDASRFDEPDRLIDLNKERLTAFDDSSQDFVIASHVLEHLVEPLGQLRDIWRILRPGGVFLFFLPDRTLTFDRARQPTPLAHLVDELDRGVTELDDAHLIEFTANVEEDWGDAGPPRDEAERFERHRLRSIHVHCWTEDEFVEVLEYTISDLGLEWELLDRLGSDEVENGFEFGMALRRPSHSPAAGDPDGRRFRDVWSALVEGKRTNPDAARRAGELSAASQALDEANAQLERQSHELAGLRTTLAQHERFLRPLRRVGLTPLIKRAGRRLSTTRGR